MIRTCAACGQQNRIPPEHLADAGRCGNCKGTLPPASEPIDVDAEEFRRIVKASKVPILVDFWADWCAPCRMAAPMVKQTAQVMAGKALVLKVDTEANPELARMFQIRGIPNFVVLKDGNVVLQQAGLVRSEQMQHWLAQAA